MHIDLSITLTIRYQSEISFTVSNAEFYRRSPGMVRNDVNKIDLLCMSCIQFFKTNLYILDTSPEVVAAALPRPPRDHNLYYDMM